MLHLRFTFSSLWKVPNPPSPSLRRPGNCAAIGELLYRGGVTTAPSISISLRTCAPFTPRTTTPAYHHSTTSPVPSVRSSRTLPPAPPPASIAPAPKQRPAPSRPGKPSPPSKLSLSAGGVGEIP
jgi:hypothetical protein